MNNPLIILPRLLKFLPTVIIGITSACFVIGLLIVNFRLSWYGIYAKEFARTEYILVGAVFIFLVATAQASFTFSKRDFRLALQDMREKRIGKALGNIFFGLMTFSAPLIVIFGYVFLNNEFFLSWTALLSILCLVLIGHYANIFLDECAELVRSIKSPSEKNGDERVASTNRLLGQIAFLLFFSGVYANFVYPHIPPAFGGGYKSPVMLYPNEKGLILSKALALPLHENPSVVGPIQVLTESESEIIALVPDPLTGKQQAVRLRRDLFDAIQTVTPTGHRT